jgi:hypothetical protein
MAKVYVEPANELPIFDECDILIVGGGCAGHSAAIAAARAGAKNIILLERYGYMGGDVTGGYVIMVPNLSWYDKSFVRGLQEEWFTRLEKIPGAVLGPGFDEIGSESPVLIDRWKGIHDCVSRGEDSPIRITRAVYFEPNQLKIELDKMLLEEKDRIRVCYHCWAAKPIMDKNEIKGVIFESKEGRKAIMAKVVIDATGDGDIFSQTGAPFNDLTDPTTRSSNTCLVFRVAGVDFNAFDRWKRANPGESLDLDKALATLTGFRIKPLPTNNDEMVWFNNWLPNRSCINVKDLTDTEMSVRDKIREVISFMKKAVPIAFKNAYLYDIAPQTGNRCSRRLKGEYIMTSKDFAFHQEFDDVIAWHSTICRINDSAPVEIPYRAIIPQKVENLLCPGRHLSADAVAIDWLNLIPQCIGTGQAAGVAAAVAVGDASYVRDVNIRKVQDILVTEQDVPLPRHPKTDPSLMELCRSKEYGLYTSLAKAAREENENLNQYRQW